MAINWLLKVDAEIADGEVASEQSKRKGTNMANLRRNYSQKTLKILYALSGNKCAYPECNNHVIEPETEESDDLSAMIQGVTYTLYIYISTSDVMVTECLNVTWVFRE